jgi:hypothetical protein
MLNLAFFPQRNPTLVPFIFAAMDNKKAPLFGGAFYLLDRIDSTL